MSSLGERLHILRTTRGVTQDEISSKTGISRSNISKIEKNKIVPSATAIVQICTMLDVTTDWLLMGNNINVTSAQTAALSDDEIKLLGFYKNLDDIDKKGILERARAIAEIRIENAQPVPLKRKPKTIVSKPMSTG